MTAKIRPISISAMALVLFAAVAFLAFWQMRPAAGGPDAKISYNVEYKVFSPSGSLLSQGVYHNAATDNLLNDAVTSLSGGTAPSGAYEYIAICSAAANGSLTQGQAPTACTLQTNATDSGSNGTAGIGAATLTVSTGTSDNSNWKLVDTFTASTNSVDIAELQMLKSSSSNVASNIGAVRATSITLNNGDTLQVTWTVTVS